MAIAVTNKKVLSNEGYGITINQMIQLFINPELKKRKKSRFKAALIELFDYQDNIVRIDNEFKCEFELMKPILKKTDVGKPKNYKLEDLKDISWHEKSTDPNSAKILLIKWNKDWWIIDYDFRYNKQIAKKLSNRSEEFLSLVELAYKNKYELYKNPLIELLWASAELVIDSKLFLIPTKQRSKKHSDKKERLNKLASPDKNSIFSQEFLVLFNYLTKSRKAARYCTKKIKTYPKGCDLKSFLRESVRIIKDEIPYEN